MTTQVRTLSALPVQQLATPEQHMPFTEETITTTTRRWIIPADQGVPVGDIEATTGIAAAAVREAYGISEEVALPGDALTFSIEANQLVIAFTHQGLLIPTT